MKDELSEKCSKVFLLQSALESLRAMDIPRALEILEAELDMAVLQLHTLAKEGDSEVREQFVSKLRGIRAYRQIHPRQTESDLSTVASGVLGRSIQFSKERVRKILDDAV